MTAEQSLQPTRPELEIMKLLWRRKSLSAREIADELAEALGWSYSTLRTVIERMCEKGLLKKRARDGVNVYAAGVGKITLLGRMIQDFSGRVLELDAAPPAVLFAQSKLLTHDEVEELEKLLRSQEGKQ
jgi:predicted transcriptional regulator